MKALLTLSCIVAAHAPVYGQTVEITVQKVPQRGEVVPATDVVVRASQSPNQQSAAVQRPVAPEQTGADQNVYVLSPASLGSPIDVTITHPACHPWVVKDLYLAPGQDQRLSVRLFHHEYPLQAPECLALKTQYELLFRKEQQLAPDVDRAEIEHRARLKYADGLFALPNPNREHLQSPQVRQMLESMDGDDYGELGGMMDGLFELFEMDSLEQYVPSSWETVYIVNGRRMATEVRLFGTHGTYQNRAGTHSLEDVDVVYSERDEAVVIFGTWRYRPGTPDEASGPFRWVVSDDGGSFEGSPEWSGTLIRGPDDGLD